MDTKLSKRGRERCKKIDEIVIIFMKAPRTVRKWTSTSSSNSKQQRGNENINKSSIVIS